MAQSNCSVEIVSWLAGSGLSQLNRGCSGRVCRVERNNLRQRGRSREAEMKAKLKVDSTSGEKQQSTNII